MKSLCDPNCDVCGGSGYYRTSVPMSHPDFGKLHPCPRRVETMPVKLYDYLGLQKEDLGREWADFKMVGNLAEVLDIVRSTLALGYGWVYIWGGYGQGKTTILKTAVSLWFRNKSHSCGYVTMSDLVENVREAYDTESPTQEKVRRVDLYSTMDLLCVDEIDRLRSTEFMQETQFTVLDRRYQGSIYKHGVTIIASNKRPDTLGDYLKSRIMDQRFKVLELKVPDLRKVMLWDQEGGEVEE